MSDRTPEDWTTDPYPLVLNRAKLTRERLRARHKGEDPQLMLAEGWPPPGWESGDCPVNDGNEAIGQWLDLVGKAMEQLDGLVGRHGLAENDLGGKAARDAWRLLRHLHEQRRWTGDLPEAPGQALRPIDGLAMLGRLRNALEDKPTAGEGVGPVSPGTFRQHGHDYSISPKQWCLLKALYGREAVPVEDIIEEVYGHDAGTVDSTVRKLTHDLNNTLLEHKLPYEVVTPSTGYLQLICTS